ncbi:GlsB/YeaQ/YmgE family stress response membrane protein [Sphingomonas bacterium]|uniref:GlsB/YeaQ/YmgE family stress response membrane protein n=1 Tax=Sphingomonas bacterium TaxID=1895847 RepID=UPI0020C67455|nr:GlsB/YeaQ/YmgE family stress response membrane protein [Sphingomonas bacterium]
MGMGTGLIGWIIIGGIVGWLAGIIMRDRESIFLNIIIGIVGAGIAGWLFGQSFHQNGLNIYSFVGSLVGAIILLAIVNLIRRGRVR